jgi:hypothetical protein
MIELTADKFDEPDGSPGGWTFLDGGFGSGGSYPGTGGEGPLTPAQRLAANKAAGDDARDRIRSENPDPKIEQPRETPLEWRRIDGDQPSD